MEQNRISKVLIAAIIVATLSSVAHGASLKRLPSAAEVLVTDVIPPILANATQEMINLNQFLTSTDYIQNPVLMLPNINTQSCSLAHQLKDKLIIAYKKLFTFRSPLYMAFSYEENQGPQHRLLAQGIKDISSCLNGTTVALSRMMKDKSFPVPADQGAVSEADLDQYCRGYLEILANNTIVNLTITDDVVKIYRNYVTLYLLHDVIREAAICITGV